MSPRCGAFILLSVAVVGGGAVLTLAGRDPVSAASGLPNRVVVAQLAADAGGGAQPEPASATTVPTTTPTRTPTPFPTVIPEPMPTYMPPDPYYYPY